MAKNAVPANDLKSFIAWLKANPGKASEGTAGPGSPQHVSGVFFQNATGTNFQFIPYRGAAPAMQALMSGEIDMIIDDPTQFPAASAHRQDQGVCRNRQKPLGSGIGNSDSGRSGIARVLLFAVACAVGAQGHAEGRHRKLDAALVAALADPLVRSRLADLGQEIFPRQQQTPETLDAYHKAEIDKWWPIIKAANIKAE